MWKLHFPIFPTVLHTQTQSRPDSHIDSDSARISVNSNYPRSSLRALVGCHFWINTDLPTPAPLSHLSNVPCIWIPALVSAPPLGLFGTAGGWIPNALAYICWKNKDLLWGDERAVWGCRGVGRAEKSDDNFISVSEVGSRERWDKNGYMSVKGRQREKWGGDGTDVKWKGIVKVINWERKYSIRFNLNISPKCNIANIFHTSIYQTI